MIHSLDPEQPSVELRGISGATYDERESKLDVAAIQIGINGLQLEAGGHYRIYARLQPSGILGPVGSAILHFDGKIEMDSLDDGVASFETSFGKFEARETYEYLTTQAHGNDVTERIQRATILGSFNTDIAGTSLSMHDTFCRTVDDVCAALSLCYRQSVACYEIEYMHSAALGTPASIYRRRWSSPKKRRKGDELVAARDLSNGGLQRLLQELASNSSRDALLRAIRFLAASYEESIEIAYFMAFSAMETAVNACLEEGQNVLATKSQWKKLEPALRETIATAGASAGVKGEAVEEMKNKLTELKRASLQARIGLACERFDPETSDLWPGFDFIEGFRRAAKVRNELFHSADSADMTEMYGNLIRIRTFTERLLLRQLKWPDDKIWVWYDQPLKWLNSGRSRA